MPPGSCTPEAGSKGTYAPVVLDLDLAEPRVTNEAGTAEARGRRTRDSSRRRPAATYDGSEILRLLNPGARPRRQAPAGGASRLRTLTLVRCRLTFQVTDVPERVKPRQAAQHPRRHVPPTTMPPRRPPTPDRRPERP